MTNPPDQSGQQPGGYDPYGNQQGGQGSPGQPGGYPGQPGQPGGYPGQPGQGPPPYQPPPTAYGGHQQPPKNGMGTASIVCSLVGLLGLLIPCVGWIMGVLGIVFGALGVSRANKGQATNKNVAMAGLVIGVVVIALSTLAVFLWADIDAEVWTN